MKREIDRIDATPSKRLFLSIIADYDLNRSICELVDNGLDVWVRGGRSADIAIDIRLDKVQQIITVKDNAGGLPRSELRYVVGPGQTGTEPTDETIGIFGVGTKRAVVALAQDIRISTRHSKQKTYRVEFDDDWLSNEDWELPVYEVDEISPGTTIIELQRLRSELTDDTISQLRTHLSATYARFLRSKSVQIRVNQRALLAQFFDNWAYPPSYVPRKFTGTLKSEDNRDVKVEAIAGLSRESSPATGEYGVYFYCNDRLVARALKTFEVGFTKGFAGLPHPKISLTRVLISLTGDARAMPWNSSKSDIDTKHKIFVALHDWIAQVVKDYATLSRIWIGEWEDKVFRYKTGKMIELKNVNFPEVKKSYLPPLPKSRPRYGEQIANKNRAIAKRKPWVTGLYEGVIAADLISKQKLEQKNRLTLIILDSTLEIAFKEFLVNESGTTYNDAKLLGIFGNRTSVHDEIKKYVTLLPYVWKKIEHYYRIRCKLIHERVTVGVSDSQIEDFRDLVQTVLSKMYKLKFEQD